MTRFKLRYNGVMLNELFEVVPISRPTPEFRVESTSIPGVDGELFESLTLGTRESVVRFVALKKDTKELQYAARKLMEIIAVREPARLYFGDEEDADGNDLYRLAVPVGAFDMAQFIRAGYWDVRFVQHDPFLYGKERSVVVRGSERVKAGGNADAFAIVRTIPNGSAFTLSNGSEHITYKAPFNGSTKLTIYMESQRISVSQQIGGEGLQPGSRFFPMRGDMVLSATSKATVSWVERWL